MFLDINSIAQKHIYLLRESKLSDVDIIDFLSSIILWKYISETNYKSILNIRPPDGALKFREICNNKEQKVSELIYEELNKWEHENVYLQNALSIKKSLVDNIENNILYQICESFNELDFQDFCAEIPGYFNYIEAETLKLSKEAHLFSTPSEIASLLVSLVTTKNEIPEITLYDPFCRSGEILSKGLAAFNNINSVTGLTTYHISWKMSFIKSIVLQFPNAEIKQSNIYVEHFQKKFDYIISNPPFGGKQINSFNKEDDKWSIEFGGNKTELDFLCHSLDRLNENGNAALIVPLGILFGSGKIQEFRKRLIESNLVEGIVMLPQAVFFQTKVITAILIINRNKTTRQTLIFNAARMGHRLRDRHILSEPDISYIKDIFNAFREQKTLSSSDKYLTISPEQFNLQNFDFQFSKYYHEQKNEENPRPSSGVWKEMASLINKLKEIDSEIDRLIKNS